MRSLRVMCHGCSFESAVVRRRGPNISWSRRYLATSGPAVERMTGIEPALSAWEAEVLPLNYIRVPGIHVTG